MARDAAVAACSAAVALASQTQWRVEQDERARRPCSRSRGSSSVRARIADQTRDRRSGKIFESHPRVVVAERWSPNQREQPWLRLVRAIERPQARNTIEALVESSPSRASWPRRGKLS